MALRGADDVMAAVARAREAARGEPAARLARRAASAAERLALAEDPGAWAGSSTPPVPSAAPGD